MSLRYGPYNIQVGLNKINSAGAYPDTAAMLFYNDSPFFVDVSPLGGKKSSIGPFSVDIVLVGEGYSGNVEVNAIGYLSTGGQSPASVAFILTMAQNDPIYQTYIKGGYTGYPLQLNRLSSIGNSVNTTVATAAQSLANDGNASGTSVIETSIGGTVYISMTNDGVLHYKTLSNNVLTEVITITPSTSGPATVLFHGIADSAAAVAGSGVTGSVANATNAANVPVGGVGNGTLNSGVLLGSKAATSAVADSANSVAGANVSGTVANATNATNASNFTGTVNASQLRNGLDWTSNANDVYVKSNSSTGGVHHQTSLGVGIGYFDSSGNLKLEGGGYYFADGAHLTRYHGFSGTGSGTFNHNCGTTPNAISLTTAAVGSQTMGYDTLTSTQCHVTTGAGLAWQGQSILY